MCNKWQKLAEAICNCFPITVHSDDFPYSNVETACLIMCALINNALDSHCWRLCIPDLYATLCPSITCGLLTLSHLDIKTDPWVICSNITANFQISRSFLLQITFCHVTDRWTDRQTGTIPNEVSLEIGFIKHSLSVHTTDAASYKIHRKMLQ